MIPTSFKRSCLEDAWEDVKGLGDDQAERPLRARLRENEKATRKMLAGGSYKWAEANSRKSIFEKYGEGVVTPLEVLGTWRELIDLYDGSVKFLEQCALYDLDPEEVELQGFPQSGLTQVGSPEAVGEETLFNWMMDHLVAVTEARGDYSHLREQGIGYA
jgi:hypothetical protein